MVEDDPDTRPDSFLFDAVEFVFIVVYLAVPVGSSILLDVTLGERFRASPPPLPIMAGLASYWPLAFIPFMFRMAQSHAARFMEKRKKR